MLLAKFSLIFYSFYRILKPAKCAPCPESSSQGAALNRVKTVANSHRWHNNFQHSLKFWTFTSTHPTNYCSDWLRPKLNPKVSFNHPHHHYPPPPPTINFLEGSRLRRRSRFDKHAFLRLKNKPSFDFPQRPLSLHLTLTPVEGAIKT